MYFSKLSIQLKEINYVLYDNVSLCFILNRWQHYNVTFGKLRKEKKITFAILLRMSEREVANTIKPPTIAFLHIFTASPNSTKLPESQTM